MLFLLVTSVLALAFETRTARADGTVYINADGSITPSTAPVSTFDNVTYTLTGNVSQSVVVDRGNIVVDGAGYTVQGSGSGTGLYAESVDNVTIENVTVADFSDGIWLNASSNCVLSDNSVTGNGDMGVYVETSSYDALNGNDVYGNYEGIILDTSNNNTLSDNEAEGNPIVGIYLYYSSNNTLSDNNVTGSLALGGIGVSLTSSPDNTLYGNNVTANCDGIGLSSSGGCVFSQNLISQCAYVSFADDGSTVGDFINWVDPSNLIDGKPIYYIVNQNGLLFDGSTHPSVGYLALVNCTDITAENLTLANTNWEALQLAYSTNCTITQNNIIDNQYGIYLSSSVNNTVSDNNVTAANQYTADGIELDSSFNNTVSLNNVTGQSGGINLDSSSDNALSANRIVQDNGGIGVSGANNTVSGNLISGSTSWGMVLLGTVNSVVSGNTVTQSNGGIDLDDSFEDTVSANNVTGNGGGIGLDYECFNDTVSSNVVSENAYNGIGGGGCSNDTVSFNNVTGNVAAGIMFRSNPGTSFGNIVFGNSVVGNGYGIVLNDLGNDTVYHNSFINNTQQVAISGSEGDTWDEGYPSGGNYWSDYSGTDVYSGPYQNVTGSDGIGDTPYVIDANNTDHYPLMNPYSTGSFSATISPGSTTLIAGRSQLFSSTVSGGTLPYRYQWFINGTPVSGAIDSAWTFTSSSVGSYAVYVNITDSVGAQAASNDANVTVSMGIHDVGVTSVTPTKTVVGQGYSLNTSVTVENPGDYPETFNTTLYANATAVGTITVTNLSYGTVRSIVFAWNTVDIAYGNYTISAYAWPVQNETNTANNNMTGGTVYVGIPGDINGDGTVDIYDAILLAAAYGSTPGSRNWNANADINGDGIVDIYDAIILSGHFGQTVDS